MEFYESGSDDDDAEAKYYSKLHYVDNESIEIPQDNVAIVSKQPPQLHRLISKRYWFKLGKPDSSPITPVATTNKNGYRQHFSETNQNGLILNIDKPEAIKSLPGNKTSNNISTTNLNIPPNKSPFHSINSEDTTEQTKTSTKVIVDVNKSIQQNNTVLDSSVKGLVDNTKTKKIEIINSNESFAKSGKPLDSSINKNKGNQSIKKKNFDGNENQLNKNKQNKISSPVISKTPNKKKKQSKCTQNSVIDDVIDLDTSDGESVIEILQPPQPSILIDSTDDECEKNEPIEEEIANISNSLKINKCSDSNTKKNTCVSPVPSIVSSTSDDFIQQDCSSLNISKENASNFEFNFKLHGTDLGDDIPVELTPKQKSTVTTSTPMIPSTGSLNNSKITNSVKSSNKDLSKDVFLTPKTKGKQNKSKNKSYTVSDENYTAPFTDIYDSESSDIPESVVEMAITPLAKKARVLLDEMRKNCKTPDSFVSSDNDTLIMANVVGVSNPKEDIQKTSNTLKTSPLIDSHSYIDALFSDEKITAEKCREDMKKFYNESWGGENFDHMKLRSQMPAGKDLWRIDIEDKIPYGKNRRMICDYCNKYGHRVETCRLKPKICFMCGTEGHIDTKCPHKMCLNCGSKNNDYTIKCRTCISWKTIKCGTCKIFGHPTHKCPDQWRRYHLTVKNEIPLVSSSSKKNVNEIYCSGCARKGHYVHDCRIFNSKFIVGSSFIHDYTPIYIPDGVRDIQNDKKSPGFNQSKQISTTNTSIPSKENMSPLEKTVDDSNLSTNKRKIEVLKSGECSPKKIKTSVDTDSPTQKASEPISSDDFISLNTNEALNIQRSKEFISSMVSSLENGDKPPSNSQNKNNNGKSQMILTASGYLPLNKLNKALKSTDKLSHDNYGSAQMLLTENFIKRLSSTEGSEHLNHLSFKHNIIYKLQPNKFGNALLLLGDRSKQTAFQSDLKLWLNIEDPSLPSMQQEQFFVPNKKKNAVKKLMQYFASLNKNIGDPSEIYNELKSLETEFVRMVDMKEIERFSINILRSKINKLRRDLNIVLFGQYGLENGKECLIKINEGLQFIRALQSKFLGKTLRKELTKYIAPIFAPIPRDNYPKLIEQCSNMSIKPVPFEPSVKALPLEPAIKAVPSAPSIKSRTLLNPIQKTYRRPAVKRMIKALNLTRSRLKDIVVMEPYHSDRIQETFKNIQKHEDSLLDNNNLDKNIANVKKFTANVNRFLCHGDTSYLKLN